MKMSLIVLAAIVGGVQAQPQRATASIEGIVVKLGTGKPLAGASVQLNMEVPDEQLQSSESRAREQFRRTATAEGNGRFIFQNVAPGQYRLIATYEAGGYVPVEYGQRSPTGQGIPFEIAARTTLGSSTASRPKTMDVSHSAMSRPDAIASP
jgi:hypothetical protein